ncbi:PspA/IM30 family protein [Ketobacter alkanivorans]|uniref:Phage shock protein A n=1 Tax=Ketobacter alkanivorans TaxID=1917421 RepID=A0A2K9LM28_9GAMM|nr:PspA/IM30 family protein [Ketobacter alkanivorans]AUM13388.1 phage shock protein A [Ketobacter alkanivorans]MCP5019930.1 PspA/IM30 family protein [Ketobacter sp.]
MSSVLNKIWTALRGGVREMGDAIVDSNGVRIFEQEIVDAKASIGQAKHNLTEVMARKMQAERKVSSFVEEIRNHETYASKALDQNDEALALEVAGKIATLENNKAEQDAIVARLTGQVEQLKAHIKKAEKLIADHERELSIVRTTESVQKATEQVVENVASNNSTLNSARESLERIKARQEMKQDQMEAGELLEKEMSGNDLDSKLESAGIKGESASAADILARIKAGKQ